MKTAPPISTVASGTAHITRYFARPIDPGEDFGLVWTDASGGVRIHRSSARSLRLAEIEASAYLIDTEGRRRSLAKEGGARWDHSAGRFGRLVRPGRWRETPHAPFGLGNRANPLAPWVHCAADPRFHPYGSRVTVADWTGRRTPEGEELTGVFWVADSGDAIRGPLRFDWMIGDLAAERRLDTRLKRHDWHAEVEPLPSPTPGYDPLRPMGLQRLLVSLGFSVGSSGPDGDGVDGMIGRRTLAALGRFQRIHAAIPEPERDRPFGAITTWHLAEAAVVTTGSGLRD